MKQLVKPLICTCVFFYLLNVSVHAAACTGAAVVCFEKNDPAFPLVANGKPAMLVLDAGADSAIQYAVKSFAEDLQRVSGRKAKLVSAEARFKKPVVLIAEYGKSALVDGLVAENKLNLDALENAWEAFQITVVEQPWPGVEKALVVVGSDRRGAVYGTYTLAEEMGVSPWYWFADVPVKKQKNVFITPGVRIDKPAVRYRGFFINDEDPALSGWAQKKFGGVNAAMYEHVFELLLRMKGNYIWPAMWSPKAFHLDDPQNRVLADAMGVVMGTSHHEPLTRAQSEWHRSEDERFGGAWNYETNAENLEAFWREGLERMMNEQAANGEAYENLLTIGMRGDGDEPMSEGTAIELLESIVATQRRLIEEVTGKQAEEVPQVWALYKEVQDYYDKGMTVPDDVILLFADDNWGQIRRLPTTNIKRKGGFGVYYHFDYVGGPRNYKWLNTVQIEKVWQQMNLAYERGARSLWVVNVGDIKPMEYPLDFFMKMAWQPERMSVNALQTFPEKWAAQWFPEEHAEDIAELITRYSQYAAFRKPELINENTFAVGGRTREALIEGELTFLIKRWRKLHEHMLSVKTALPREYHSAFFQSIEHPISALANLYELYYATAWNQYLSRFHDARANYFIKPAQAAWARDIALTEKYHAINKGKWNGMMNQVHMNYVHWNTPITQNPPPLIYVAADTPLSERHKAPVFVAKAENQISLELGAEDYSRAYNGKGLTWTAIPNLGKASAAMLALPQGQPATEIQDNVALEYQFEWRTEGEIQVRLQLSPTLDTHGEKGMRVGVSLNGGPPTVLLVHLIPTAGAVQRPEQQYWYDAVITNTYDVTTAFSVEGAGEQRLKVWRLDDNVVLEKIEIKAVHQ